MILRLTELRQREPGRTLGRAVMPRGFPSQPRPPRRLRSPALSRHKRRCARARRRSRAEAPTALMFCVDEPTAEGIRRALDERAS